MDVHLLEKYWPDILIVIILFYFIWDSFLHNFFVLLVEFISFLLSILIGLRFYTFISDLIATNISIPNSISKALGFLITVLISEGIFAAVLIFLARKIPEKIRKAPLLNYFRFIIGFFDGILLLSFLIPLTLASPIPSGYKERISSSRLGGVISEKTAFFESKYSEIFGDIISDGLNLLTVNPRSDKRILLNVSSTNLKVDFESEANMLKLVNVERRKAGVRELVLKEEAVLVARKYAEDMWKREYFSHYSPEGTDVSDRLEENGIAYSIVGENLALAPTLLIAHNGLMNSEGHKKNILDTNFRKVAIGVIDNGIHGKLFVQIFTD